MAGLAGFTWRTPLDFWEVGYGWILQLFHAHLRANGVAVRWTHPMASERGMDIRAKVRDRIAQISAARQTTEEKYGDV